MLNLLVLNLGIPIVHHVIKVHEWQNGGEKNVETKGYNNEKDGRILCPLRSLQLQELEEISNQAEKVYKCNSNFSKSLNTRGSMYILERGNEASYKFPSPSCESQRAI